MAEKLNRDDFVMRAVRALPTGKSKGITVSPKGALTCAFRLTYKADPKATVKRLVKTGQLVSVSQKKGAQRLYLPADAPLSWQDRGKVALSRMGI